MQASAIRFGKVIHYRTNSTDLALAMIQDIQDEDRYAIASCHLTPLNTKKGTIEGYWVRGLTGSEAHDLFKKMNIEFSPADTKKQLVEKTIARITELAKGNGFHTDEYRQKVQQIVEGADLYHRYTGNPVEDRGIDIVG